MISTGRVSQPEIVEKGKCFPERWLANGDPYEFSSHPTVEGDYPLPILLEAFCSRLILYCKSLKIEEDLSGVLGVYFTHDPDTKISGLAREDIIWVEKTEGRRNFVEAVPREEANSMPNAIQAAWNITFKKREGSKEEWDILTFTACSCIANSTEHVLNMPDSVEINMTECVHQINPGFLISERLVC